MLLMLQQKKADDYVIATGQTNKLSDFIRVVFKTVGLDWENHIRIDRSLFRPTDIAEGYANPAKAFNKLGWQASALMEDVGVMMVEKWLEMPNN
jgi:GDPmannose 4,6-dehydratase